MAEFHQLRPLHSHSSNNDNNNKGTIGVEDNDKELPVEKQWNVWNDQAEYRARNSPTAIMPSLNHLSLKDYDKVYEPAADTFLLIDAIQYEFNNNNSLMNDTRSWTNSAAGDVDAEQQQQQDDPFVVLEIGCGSGVPSVFFQTQWQSQQQQQQQQRSDTSSCRIRRRRKLLSYATDINPDALRVTRQTMEANRTIRNQQHQQQVEGSDNDQDRNGKDSDLFFFELVRCDLASALLPRLQGCVDVLLFNPPYVPTPDSEIDGAGIEVSWAGGKDGRRVIDRAISQIGQLLRQDSGVAYMITVDDNHPIELAQKFKDEAGLIMKPLFRRRAFNEYLTVQKLTRSNNNSSNDES